MVPQPTAQYGQVERVSLARAILSTRSCAKAGCKSNPNTAAAAPPTVLSLRKSRLEGFIYVWPPSRAVGGCCRTNAIDRTLTWFCQVNKTARQTIPTWLMRMPADELQPFL